MFALATNWNKIILSWSTNINQTKTEIKCN